MRTSSPRVNSRAVNWREYDVVALCNIAQFTAEEAGALDDFLKQGGGVVIFGGDQVVPENYNRLLFADGKGLLPAQVGASVGDAGKKESGFEFDPLGFRHPIVEPFANEPDAVVAGLTRREDVAIPQAEAAERHAGQGRPGV